ncbi:MAG: TerB family tellurite resistance protein [Paludibacteraceae bacterium]
MAGFTKWITGGLGFVLGGPIGGVIGFAIGSLIDGTAGLINPEEYQQQQQQSRSPYNRTAEGDFKMSLLVLIACVMKADGSPKKQELDVVKRFLLANFGEDGALEALQILKNLLKQNINDEEVARQINYAMNYASKLELIHLLFEIAYADGAENQYELTVIHRISWNLGVSNVDFDALKAPYTRTKDVNWAYTALEIQPSATDTEIKKAYREMAKKYHPDTVANLGEDIKKKATEKFRSVNEAYEELKKTRGFK